MIQINFEKGTDSYQEDRSGSEKDVTVWLLGNYKGFLYRKRPEKIDYTITFLRSEELFVSVKGKQTHFRLYEQVGPKNIHTYYHISRIQFMLILRTIIEQLLEKKGFVIHCSSCVIKDKAWIFTGEQGAGKSTIVSLLKEDFPTLADDRGYIRKEEGKWYFYQGFFLDRNGNFLKKSTKYQLAGICFLRRSSQCHMDHISSKGEVLELFLKQIWTQNKQTLKKKLPLIVNMSSQFRRFFLLSFSLSNKGLAETLIRHTPLN